MIITCQFQLSESPLSSMDVNESKNKEATSRCHFGFCKTLMECFLSLYKIVKFVGEVRVKRQEKHSR